MSVRLGPVAATAAALLLAACASTPTAPSGPGTAAGTPRGVYKVGNPYQISGAWYYPKEDLEYVETGIASWYGSDFHGKSTANGESYDMHDMTAAHRTLPLPSMVRVTNLENGRTIALRVNDRGPFARGRIIDVSRRGAQLLGFERQGTAKVRVEIMRRESEELARIYRDSGTIGQALARTPAAGQEPAVAMAAVPPAPAVLPPPAPGPVIAAVPVPSVERVPLAPAPIAPTPIASSPLAPSLSTGLPPAPVPAAGRTPIPSADLPQPPVVTLEVVRPTQIYVQAGAFAQRPNADRVRQNVAAAGPARVVTVTVSGAPIHRVRIGPLPSVEAADQALARVADAGYPEARIVVE
ncbi:MAG: septal ring lytic transglycosylase RlpA family protein [Alphaproteobacteria bacterium]